MSRPNFKIKKVPDYVAENKTPFINGLFAINKKTSFILAAFVAFFIVGFNVPNLQTLADDTTGNLTIIKSVVGTSTPASDFTITLFNDNVFFSDPGSATGQTYTLAPGAYTVMEFPVPNGYTQTFSGDCSSTGVVNINVGDNKTCTVINTFVPTTGNLTVVKNVLGSQDPASSFTIYVSNDNFFASSTGSSVGTSYTLQPGSYTVSEFPIPTNYTQSFSGDCNESGVVNVAVGENKTCVVINTYNPAPVPTPTGPGELVVVKEVVGSKDPASDFVIYVVSDNFYATSTGSTAGTSYSLNPGGYTVVEMPYPNYITTYSGDCNQSGVVQVNSNETKTCIVTNTYTPPVPGSFTLTITKNGDGSGAVSMGDEEQIVVCTESQCDPAREQIVYSQTFASGTVITLTATPDVNSNFNGSWSSTPNVCSGNNPVCTFTLTTDTTVNAHFSLNSGGSGGGSSGSGGGGGGGSTFIPTTSIVPTPTPTPTGQVNGAFTNIPSGLAFAPEGQVLGAATTLPRTGAKNFLLFTLAVLAIGFVIHKRNSVLN